MSLEEVGQFMKFYLENLNGIDAETEKLELAIEGNYSTLILMQYFI